MLGYRRAFGLAACVALVAAAGCSGSGDDWAQASPENQGYQWRGQGEPGNFGAAFSFCRSTFGEETEGQRLEGASGTILGTTGGPTTIPGYSRSTQSVRSDVGNRRQFAGCMESQGWVASDSPTTPPLQPKF